ncbi:MAG TPA: hypothetical protein VJT15_03270 [Pyrinomonadaceae bacterium]|nr:hypothetical protein [Pyrinomonadaceae bacterium]
MRKTFLTLLVLACCCQYISGQPSSSNSKQQQRDAASEPSPVPTASAQDKIDNEAEAAREAYRKERDAIDDKFRADQARQNEIIATASARMVWITAVNVFIAAVYGVFAYLTLRAVKKQADHTSDQVGVTKNQLAAMNQERRVLHTHAGAMFQTARYTKQMLNAMQEQLAAMEREAGAAEEALVVSNRASVGVHSIDWNKEAGTIFIRIENIGLVPAEQINLIIEVLAIFNLQDITPQSGDKPRGFLRFPVSNQSYGNTKLFRGNFQIIKPFGIKDALRPSEIKLIEADRGVLVVRGHVTYQDGFDRQSPQKTEFLFGYYPNGNVWGPASPELMGSRFDKMGPADNERGNNETEQQNPN